MLELTRRYPHKRAFITGGASGLGRSFALRLARDGWDLWIADLREEPLHAVCAEVQAAGGVAHAVVLDVTNRPAYQDTVKTVLAAAGGMDLLINNAGVAGGGRMGEYTLEDWDWLLGINLMGVVHGCHFFTPQFKTQQAGHIINIASAAALAPAPSMAAYCASKAAVKILSEVLHNELHGHHVDVMVVMPEFFNTPLHERARGPEKGRARFLIEKSRTGADEVAEKSLEAAGRRVLHFVYPPRVNVAWWLLRAAPAWSMPLIRRAERIATRRFERHLARNPGV